MEIVKTELDGVVIISPKIFGDDRGCFFESFNRERFQEQVCSTDFVQDNESHSVRGVLRGMHYQLPPFAQSKLVRVVRGTVLDVAVDIRKGSPTFGRHVAVELTGENKLQLFIPRGFAHGFVVLSDEAVFQYKCDNYYSPSHEGSIRYDDPAIGIDWQIPGSQIVLSDKDQRSPAFADAKLFDFNENLYL